MRIASAEDGEIKVRVDNSWREFLVGWGIGVLTGVFATYLHVQFMAVAPPWRVWTFSGINVLIVASQFLIPTAALLRRPDAAEVKRIWSPIGRGSAVVFGVNLASAFWLLLPYADQSLRLFFAITCLAASAWQVITAAESLGLLVFYVGLIMGSAALFFLRAGGPNSLALSIFLTVYALLLVSASRSLRTTVRAALEARLAAEQAATALEAALNDARAARAERERFMAAASHDLRQPLQAATLFFRAMVKSRDRAVRAQAQAGVTLAFEETDALLQRMLEHLRLDADAITPRLEALPVVRLFARAVTESEGLADAQGVQLRAAASLHWLSADPTLAAGVLRNFVHNALRHARGTQVRLMARRRGGFVRLYVLDNGQGLPAGDHTGLFAPYVQGPRSATDRRSGLGLGLASARRMAELMGGAVDVDPAWKGGAAFYLELPIARPQAVAVSPKARTQAAGPARRVLVLDDDDAARRALAGMFAAEGWQALAAATAAEAVRLAGAEPIDLLVCDWRLGDGATGGEAVGDVRAVRPGLPALLITGDGSQESHTAIAATGLPVLFKPTPPARILEVAESLCRKAATSDAQPV